MQIIPYSDDGVRINLSEADKKKAMCTHHLTCDTPIDYCSIRISITRDGNLTLDNKTCVEKMVSMAGMEGCNSTKHPISKSMLHKAAEEVHEEDFLPPEGKTEYQHYVGR